MDGLRAAVHRPHRGHDRRPARRTEPVGPAPHPGHRRHPGPRPSPRCRLLIHLVVGQGFALGYAATFALLGQATWWLGTLLGLLHVEVVSRAYRRDSASLETTWQTDSG